MLTKCTCPLSGCGSPIKYVCFGQEISIRWGESTLKINKKLIKSIMKDFFTDDRWYPLGKRGLGGYLDANHPGLIAYHASVIAPIMVKEGLLEHRIDKDGTFLRVFLRRTKKG